MSFSFLRDESGAITVDYVVLTAACAFLGVAVTATVSGGTEDRANNFADRQVEVWRKGENALANYNPSNQMGFDMFYSAVQSMDSSELAALSAYSKAVQSNTEALGTLPPEAQVFLNEMEASIAIQYAETRGVRMNTEDFSVDEVQAVWDTYEFQEIEAVYGTSSQTHTDG